MSELKLTDREWNEFLIGELFDIKIGKNLDGNKVNKVSGKTAYITRKESNNALDGFVDSEKTSYLNEDFPVITVGNETAEPFVQNYPFFTGTKVNILNPRVTLSSRVLSFIATSLKSHKSKYSYSYTINSTRLRKQKILLPVKNNKPDWQFMENYIKQIELKQREQIRNYYNSLINKELFAMGGGKSTLENVEWRSFFIQDVFTFKKKPSKGLTHLIEDENGINYIGATNRNNGVLATVKREGKRVYQGNAIVFIRNGEGSMGYSVYKHEDFIATQDVSVGYNDKVNRYSGLFITVIADRVRGKYNFGYKRNQSRLNKEVLTLPIDENGNPNWQFMENYMKQIELKKLQQYIDYTENQILLI